MNPNKPLWAALLFAMFFPSATTWIYFVVLAKPDPATSERSFVALAAYGASKTIQFAFPLIWILAFEKGRIAIVRPRARDLTLGTLIGLVIMASLLVIYYGGLRSSAILASTPGKVLAQVQSFHVATPFTYALMTIFLAGVHSLMEEYYWRWFVFRELRKLIPTTAALVVSSAAFMAHHVIILGVYFPGKFWIAALPFAFGVGVGGAAWAWLYQRTGRLYAPWVSHMFADIAIMAAGYDMIFVQRANVG